MLPCQQDGCTQIFTNFLSFRRHLIRLHTQSIPNRRNSCEELLFSKYNQTVEEVKEKDEKEQTNLCFEAQSIQSIIDDLKQKSLEFTLSLYDLTLMPRKHVLQIQNNIVVLLCSVSTAIEKQVSLDTVNRINPILGFCKDP